MEKITYPLTDENYVHVRDTGTNNYILFTNDESISEPRRFFSYTDVSKDAFMGYLDKRFYWIYDGTERNPDAANRLSLKALNVKVFLKHHSIDLLNANIERVYNILDLEPEDIKIISAHDSIPYDYELLKDFIESNTGYRIMITLKNADEELRALFILSNGLTNLSVTINDGKADFDLSYYLVYETESIELYINNVLIPLTIKESVIINI